MPEKKGTDEKLGEPPVGPAVRPTAEQKPGESEELRAHKEVEDEFRALSLDQTDGHAPADSIEEEEEAKDSKDEAHLVG